MPRGPRPIIGPLDCYPESRARARACLSVVLGKSLGPRRPLIRAGIIRRADGNFGPSPTRACTESGRSGFRAGLFAEPDGGRFAGIGLCECYSRVKELRVGCCVLDNMVKWARAGGTMWFRVSFLNRAGGERVGLLPRIRRGLILGLGEKLGLFDSTKLNVA